MHNATPSPSPSDEALIHLDCHFHHPLPRLATIMANRMLEWVPGIRTINDLYIQLAAGETGGTAFGRVLRLLGMTYLITSEDLAKIPASGPLIVVANHPFGGAEGIILGDLLQRIRPDTRILGNYLLDRIAPLRDSLIPVDPFGRKSSVGANLKGFRAALRWLKAGGCLVVFPAGEVSHYQHARHRITDPPWSAHVAALIRLSRAQVLPIFFPGRNRLGFTLMGMLHPRLRTLMLPSELVARRDSRVRLFVGRSIAPERMTSVNEDQALIDWLRFRTYFLANRDRSGVSTNLLDRLPLRRRSRGVNPGMQALISPVVPGLLAAEVAALDPGCILVKHKQMMVFVAESEAIPHLLREIGRLREKSFREAGEGTGKSMDVDLFDSYYHHLVLWNGETKEVVGAYRMGDTGGILSRYGRKGLYTHSLFRFKSRLFRLLTDSLELGRSFIRSEYQRQPNCLALLWKGIGAYLVRHPRYRVLFGPVSISNSYHRFSKEIMIQFLKRHCSARELQPYVSPRCPFRVMPGKGLSEADSRLSSAPSIDEISMLVSEIEGDGKRVPVLIKHYLKLSGRFIAFNVDRDFADAVDGLVVVDLMKTETRLLERFMGVDGCRAYRDDEVSVEDGTGRRTMDQPARAVWARSAPTRIG